MHEYPPDVVAKELADLNTERPAAGVWPLTAACGSSLVKWDYGKNREGYWRAAHILQHLDEYLDILETVCPGHQHLFIFDNSSRHDAFAEDALVANRMNKGWGGKQPHMRATEWMDSSGVMHAKTMIFQDGDPGPISKYGGRGAPPRS